MIVAQGFILTPPSPPDSGITIGLHGGDLVGLEHLPIDIAIFPVDAWPTVANCEIVTATLLTGRTLTITRAQHGTVARTILETDRFLALWPALMLGLLGIANGGTNASTANGALNNLLPAQASNSGKALVTNGTNASWTSVVSGTVTSIDISGGSTGLTATGGPITSSGTITLSGTLDVDNGGTGQTSYTHGQLLIGNTTGNTLVKGTLTGTSNQIVVTNGAGSITLSTPQSIGTASAVQFDSVMFGRGALKKLWVQDAIGTDAPGNSLILTSGASTGTGADAGLIFKGCKSAASTGSSANTTYTIGALKMLGNTTVVLSLGNTGGGLGTTSGYLDGSIELWNQTTGNTATISAPNTGTASRSFTLPDINGTALVWVSAPGSSSDTGTAGSIAYDGSGNLYVCYGANQWAKFTGSTSF